jgi:acyl carrier protein
VDRREDDRSVGVSTVEEVVARVFGAESASLDASSSPESVEGWDSMGHLNLIAALEKDFNVSIDIGDAMEMVSVKRIREILLDYGVRA